MNVLLKSIALVLCYGVSLYLIYLATNPEVLIVFLTISLMLPLIYLIQDRAKQKQYIDHLHQETLKAELSLLKSQINPHFFFNTLNNLYGLAVEKSDLTEEVIYRLSQMMRFTIYGGRKHTVSVEDEIAYLENFIELNQLRHQHRLDIRFERHITNDQQRIPPLLFINLLENAFKHGVDTLTNGQYIHFFLTTKPEMIEFTIENNFDKTVLEKNKKQRASGGLGLDNLKRRLILLFPDKHQIKTNVTDSLYKTTVSIDLT
ncbi:MAG: histidine kinase [Litorilituus sp.]|nr:histidine kinase [Litorilituus sp.]